MVTFLAKRLHIFYVSKINSFSLQQNIPYILEILSNLILAKKNINQECRINEQCTGTENANTCFTDGKGEREEGVCTCNDQFDWFDGKCLKGMM